MATIKIKNYDSTRTTISGTSIGSTDTKTLQKYLNEKKKILSSLRYESILPLVGTADRIFFLKV